MTFSIEVPDVTLMMIPEVLDSQFDVPEDYTWIEGLRVVCWAGACVEGWSICRVKDQELG